MGWGLCSKKNQTKLHGAEERCISNRKLLVLVLNPLCTISVFDEACNGFIFLLCMYSQNTFFNYSCEFSAHCSSLCQARLSRQSRNPYSKTTEIGEEIVLETTLLTLC